jgi:hypothetical protein
LRAASWNKAGLSAVVGNSLYLWEPGAKSVVRLLTDSGLSGARDVVAVGKNRAVIALKSTLVLVSPETITVLGTLPKSRCRFYNGELYVLQESTGVIWSLRGVEDLGTKQADQTFARSLLKQGESQPGKNPAQSLEAARILGCKETEAIVAAAASKGARWAPHRPGVAGVRGTSGAALCQLPLEVHKSR